MTSVHPSVALSSLPTLKEKSAWIAQEFESVFLEEMVRLMFKTLPKDGPFKGGFAEQITQSMYAGEVAKAIAKSPSGSLGVATLLQAQLDTITSPPMQNDGKEN